MQDTSSITFYPSNTAQLGAYKTGILAMVAEGLTKHQIADSIFRSVPTVAFHQVEARQYYGARTLTQAVARAIACGDIQFRVETATEKTTAHSMMTYGFIFAALITALVDTPFFSDTDQDLARHNKVRTTRTVKVRHGRLDLINDELVG